MTILHAHVHAYDDIRPAYLAVAHAARPLLAHPNVADRWTGPSCLPEWTVGGLATHMARAVTLVDHYLDAHVDSDESPESAAAYYAAVITSPHDVNDEVNIGIRRRADESAKLGHAAILESYDRGIERMRGRLADETPDRLVTVFGDRVISLDDYLVTRIVEILVHMDDLALSVELETPRLPAVEIAITTLVDVARLRHGDLGVLRALTRRERDPDEAMRVF